MATRIIGWIGLAVAVGIVVFQVLVPPSIGLADNGDFGKISLKFHLRVPYDPAALKGSPYIHLHYAFAPEISWRSGFHSVETLLVSVAVRLNRLITRDGTFDLRCLGALHAILFLVAFAFFVPLTGAVRPVLQAALLALAILFFCDAMYSTYYNSFYMDAAAFVFLMLALVFLVRAARPGAHGPADAWAAVLFSLLMLTSKSQHALLAIPLIVFVLWKRRAMWPRHALLASAAAVSLIAGGAAYSLIEGTPPGYANPCLFSIIFARLLPTADNPSAELASLGLDDSYLEYMGMNAYGPDAPILRKNYWAQEFLSKTSFATLARFYILHPARALYVAGVDLQEASLQRPIRQGLGDVGNYEESAGHPPYAKSNAFAMWSAAKASVLGSWPWLYPLLFVLALGIVAWAHPAGGVALGLMEALEFGLSGMTDSVEVTRHLFFFNAIWDVTLFAAVCVLVLGLDARLKRRAGKAPEARV
ncbi:MAG TPA: hypothetical protein VN893_11420 [Bryobacteraceae bacterium]|nr:hypothetical protein [Bryobacteraceae bacterium]